MVAGDTVEAKLTRGLSSWVRVTYVRTRMDGKLVTVRLTDGTTKQLAPRYVRPCAGFNEPTQSRKELLRLAGKLKKAARVGREVRTRQESALPSRKPARSGAYLAFVRSKSCMWCFKPPPSDPDHFGSRGMGQKTDDFRTVPMCRAHHEERHRTGTIAPFEPDTTKRYILAKQVDLLIEWMTRDES